MDDQCSTWVFRRSTTSRPRRKEFGKRSTCIEKERADSPISRRSPEIRRQGNGAMASVKTPLLRKVQKALKTRFPSPATVKLEDHHGIIGVITSDSFSGMESIDRQNLIGEVI